MPLFKITELKKFQRIQLQLQLIWVENKIVSNSGSFTEITQKNNNEFLFVFCLRLLLPWWCPLYGRYLSRSCSVLLVLKSVLSTWTQKLWVCCVFLYFCFFISFFVVVIALFYWGGGGGLRWQAFNLEIKHEQCYCYKNNCITTCTCTVSLNYLFAGSHDCYATLYYRRSADKLIIGEFMCKSTTS